MKAILTTASIVAVTLLFPVTSFAAGNNVPGIDRYLEIAAHPADNAQCNTGAASGAFGYLGKDLNPGDPDWDGGNGTDPGTTAQTGDNNAGVCGNKP